MASQPKTVIVIGAGVIGLQTALTLLEEGEGIYRVYVVAEFLPGDEEPGYASAWAGAQWRSHETSYTEAACWDAETYKTWMELVKRDGEGCGIALMNGVNYWTSANVSTSFLASETTDLDDPANSAIARAHSSEAYTKIPEPWWSALVDQYQPIDAPKLPPDAIFGATFKTFTIDPLKYLPYLLQRVEFFGGRVFRARLPTDGGIEAAVTQAKKVAGIDVCEPPWAVVNATGLAAKDMVADTQMYPIRGQTVRVKGTAKEVITKLGGTKSDVTAIMPRPGSDCTVVGVTVEKNVEKTEIEEDKVPFLLNRARVLAPELLNEQGSHEVLKVGVGLRPGRKGGARVELEQGTDGPVIAHAYGHAGAGYQNSIGCARKVLGLLRNHQQ